MSRGKVIHLDNEIKLLEGYKNLFDQNDIDLDYIICETKEKFEQALSENRVNIKALIFDLLSSDPDTNELHQKDAEFLENINESFSNYNIPIFVYSGYLQALDGKYENQGTVFKIDKDKEITVIFDKIKNLYESGFIDVFCPDGLLQNQLLKDLNLSFTKQFNKNTQIESIIDSIVKAKEKGSKERTQKIFQRIALRSLMSNLLAPDLDKDTGGITPDFFNPVEHYLQRISAFKFWTGDIFLQKKDQETCFLIVTPRCNVASKSFESLLVCLIKLNEFPSNTGSKRGAENIQKALNDNPKFAGYDRFLPPCPLFVGGHVLISKYQMIKKQTLLDDYDRIISLSDELTNEILGKFGAYFFRSGITPWDTNETIEVVKSITEDRKTNQ
ncbi:hypothetical protein [Psychroserpens sp. Hel_I_66]|uniref:hypothetical protein n=1 Tax=Psychroserpens sp. Hel_I_66 TaxID=1250004 RepID=UPI000645CF72|nr:hypothetical protein [Psychroserpens sp. Hel_I_66]